MDLIPKPDQIVAAAANLATATVYGGVADLRSMPRTLVDEGPQREVYHYRPRHSVREAGDPVLLVTPLAAPALCFDLRRGCSLVEDLVERDLSTYLVDYGSISFADRSLGLEHWVDEVLPEAIRAVSRHAGDRPVHLVGWSLGGIFALLAAAADPDLPIASIAALGAPADVSKVPLIAPVRPLIQLTGGGLVTRAYRLLGGAPPPLVRAAFQLSDVQGMVTRPLSRLAALDDRDRLAQLEAVGRFTAGMTAYPGRTFGQLYHRMVKDNALATGEIRLAGRTLRLADVTPPVLVVAGNTDGIAPIAAVAPMVELLSGSAGARLEIVPGGHLGLLTGRGARTTTWPALEEWFAEHASAPTPGTAPGAATGAASGAKSSTGVRTLGTGPRRRSTSAASRRLA